MQVLTKLAILFIALMNLAGSRAVDGRAAALACAVLAAFALLGRLGYSPLTDRRQTWVLLLREHRDALIRRFRQLVRVNAYGFEETDKWLDELDRFRRSVGLHLETKRCDEFDRTATQVVRRWAEREADRSLAEPDEAMTPQDYEHHCAELLRRSGWKAEVTGMSGDQGVDVVAEREGVSVAVQCKFYFGRPIGNKAVQEAHAAADFADTSHAAVVTNATFTRSAEALAHKLGVLLIHHSDLPRLDRLLAAGRLLPD